MPLDQPFVAFRFEVVLDLDEPTAGLASPLCEAAFAECDGLELTMQVKTLEVGGVNDRQVHLIGPVTAGQLTLKRGMTTNLQLWDWFARGTRPGSVLTAHGQIVVWAADGTPGLEFTLTGCLPVRMRAPGLNAAGAGGVAIEELALVYEKLEVGAAGASLGLSVGIGASVSLSAGIGLSGSVGLSAGIS
ncbi:phage tail protein [Micromonospora sp. NPDC005806]|uniref:phage tail protein n=1 Tax=Micromonospora sp. NPDC005806 TaxID=3364234 RepID=UPI00367AAF3A